jgi:hypothetical protein
MRAPRGRLARPAGAVRPRLVRSPRFSFASAPQRSRGSPFFQARLAVVAVACCAAYALVALLRAVTSPASDAGDPAADVCVAWRATTCGTQYSGRLPLEDLHCSALIRPSDKRISGAHTTVARSRLNAAPAACCVAPGGSLLDGRTQPVSGFHAALHSAASAAPEAAWRGSPRVLRVRGPAPRQSGGCAAVRQGLPGGVEERRGAAASSPAWA